MITPEQLAKSGTEHGEQAALFCWAQQNLSKYPALKWLHSSSNGIFTTSGHNAKERAAGLKKGVWDIFLPRPMLKWQGLYIEMKIGKNKLTVEQEEFRNDLNIYYCFEVCYGWQMAREVIIRYLER